MNNWMQLVAEQKTFVIKKYMFDLLEHRYGEHEQIIERMAHYLVTNQDFEAFNKLIANIYESGYMRAVNEYKEELSKRGFKVNVVADKQAT